MSSLRAEVPPAFAITVERRPKITVVRVQGDLDLFTAGRLEEALGAEAGQSLVVDLSGVTFLDSTALGVLLTAGRSAASPLPLLAPGREVRRVFEVTGLDGRFRFVSSVEEATGA